VKNIFFLGMVSFFIDLSTHMVYPIVPLYLVAVHGASPALIGVIEGIAESSANLMKVFSGYVTDRYKKKKILAFMGYVPAIIYKVTLAFAGSWTGVLVARVIDRLGKGIRTSPRNVLILESSDKNNLGKSFGMHKALDMLGVASGILIAYFIMRNMGEEINYQLIFLIAIIPAALGLLMFFFINEKKSKRKKVCKKSFWINFKKIDNQLKIYLLVVFLFTLGNSSNAFILLRAQSIGFNAQNVILLYFLFNMTASILAMPFGKLSDRIGRKKLLVPGYLVFSACYIGFAFVSNHWLMIAVFIAFGMYTAMIAGVERAYVAEIAPKRLKGTMLGLQATVVGVALLPASVIAGFLWETIGAHMPFIFGSGLSFIAALILIVFMKKK
jgi:MFS family permease